MQTVQILQTLRNAQTIARFVLVWFVLSMGAAIASPLVNPQAMELICSGTGVMKLVKQLDDGSTEPGSLTLDCPLPGVCADAAASRAHSLAAAGPMAGPRTPRFFLNYCFCSSLRPSHGRKCPISIQFQEKA